MPINYIVTLPLNLPDIWAR